MPLFLRALLLLCLGCLAAGKLCAADFQVVIVSSERSPAYQEAADALLGELERQGVPRKTTLQITPSELGTGGELTARLFVTLGADAAMAVVKADPRAPILCTLLPQESFERVRRDSGRRSNSVLSAVYINQPLNRQMDLVRLALPDAGRVGLILGDGSQGQIPAVESAAQSRGFKLVIAVVAPGEPVFKGLKKILEEADLLLAWPDQQIYNSNSIQNVLLASFRARVPLIGFSSAYVRAGALVAVYSTPAQIGIQAGATARGVLQGKTMPPPQYPVEFSVSVNEHVARSLGLTLDASALGERLRAMEQR